MPTIFNRHTNQRGVVFADTRDPYSSPVGLDGETFESIVDQTSVGFLDEDKEVIDPNVGESEALATKFFWKPKSTQLSRFILGYPYQFVIDGQVSGHPSGKTISVSIAPNGTLVVDAVVSESDSQSVDIYAVPAGMTCQEAWDTFPALAATKAEANLEDFLDVYPAPGNPSVDLFKDYLQSISSSGPVSSFGQDVYSLGNFSLATDDAGVEEFDLFVIVESS